MIYFSFLITDKCNYADDTCLYVCDVALESILRRLTHDGHKAIDWFEYNYMIEERTKFHFIVSGHKCEHLWIELDGFKIWESSEETLLGICMDRNLYFGNHENKIC